MKYSFVKELQPYSSDELAVIFGDFEGSETKGKTQEFIDSLMKTGVLKKYTKKRDLESLYDTANDAEIEESQKKPYRFKYVGLVCLPGCLLKVYPKYIFSKTAPIDDLKIVMQVLKKYKNSEKEPVALTDTLYTKVEFNWLSACVTLLEDYNENGLYINNREEYEINGRGDIDWTRTIDYSNPILQKNVPYYTELITRHRINYEDGFITKLHKVLLTECSAQLDEDVKDILGLSTVDLTELSSSDLGDEEYLLYMLERELNQEFNSRKQDVLKQMITLISKKSLQDTSDEIGFFGTFAFNLVWETCCKEVFKDNLDDTLKKLSMKAYDNLSEESKLIDIIDKPEWKVYNVTDSISKNPMKPDSIICGKKEDGTRFFAILDAKYYLFETDGKKFIYSVPGIEDINKQYLYQLVFNKLLAANGFKVKDIFNLFLMPVEDIEESEEAKRANSDDNVIRNVGDVSVKFFRELPTEPKLVDIGIRLIPANKLYRAYLGYGSNGITFNDLDIGRSVIDSPKRFGAGEGNPF